MLKKVLIIKLPLPPSKNKRTIRKGIYSKRAKKWLNLPLLTKEVLRYRELVKEALSTKYGLFEPDKKVILECWWKKKRRNQDCANFHDELCDAIAPALGLDDKWFLLRDMDFEVDSKNAGVQVRISQIGGKHEKRNNPLRCL